MTPRMSIIGRLRHSHILGQFRWRAVILGGAAAICALLTFFPERYLAISAFTPSDRDGLGLADTLGQLGAINSVFGSQAAVEVALRIGNSDRVRDDVIKNTRLNDTLKSEGRVALQRYLERNVEVRSLRGGIVVIEMQDRDPELAHEIVSALQTAIKEELGRISRRQTAYKRDILLQLVKDASDRLGVAQTEYDQYRLSKRYVDPRSSIGAMGSRALLLEDAIRGRETALSIARQLYTDDNLTVRQMKVEIGVLRRQLAEAKATSPAQAQGLGELVENSSQLYALERDLETAKSLYNSYVRYLRGTAVEDLTAEANLRVLEQPHIETKRQYWLPSLALGIAILLLWGAIETYRLRPPPGDALRKPSNA